MYVLLFVQLLLQDPNVHLIALSHLAGYNKEVFVQWGWWPGKQNIYRLLSWVRNRWWKCKSEAQHDWEVIWKPSMGCKGRIHRLTVTVEGRRYVFCAVFSNVVGLPFCSVVLTYEFLVWLAMVMLDYLVNCPLFFQPFLVWANIRSFSVFYV